MGKKHLSAFALWNVFLLFLMVFVFVFLGDILSFVGLSESAYIYLAPILSFAILEILFFRIFFHIRKKRLIVASYLMLVPIVLIALLLLGYVLLMLEGIGLF